MPEKITEKPVETMSDTNANPPKKFTPPTWEQLNLSEGSLKLIHASGFKYPTPIQFHAIPLAIQGHDVIASAQTGTGKTAAFVLPMVERFVGREGTFGLILSPTREIAQQTQATLELLGKPQGVRSIVLIGGIDMKIDDAAIASYPQIIVATPGRLCDHLERGNIWLDYIQMVVLDEADRMLDLGFSEQINRIMADVSANRQMMIFSATMPAPVENLARKFMKTPKRVAIGRPLASSNLVDQKLIWLAEEDKKYELDRILKREPGSVIVFTRSKDSASRLWRSLHSAGFYGATVIHSDKAQSDRELALVDFKSGKYRVLIATDVAGRGIHVDDVAHVINYDLPMEPEDYVHRIGRTGRKGARGKATSFATPRDRKLLGEIEAMLKSKIPSEELKPGRSVSTQSSERSRPRSGPRRRPPAKRTDTPTTS